MNTTASATATAMAPPLTQKTLTSSDGSDSDFFSGNDEDFYFETETDEEEYFESFLQSEESEDYLDSVVTKGHQEREQAKGNEQKVIIRQDLNEYTEASGQCRLLLVSLLDNFCSLYDRNPAKNQKLFSLLCRKLYSMGILKSFDFMEESRALRSIYKEAFKAIVLEAVKSAEMSSIETESNSSSSNATSIPGSPTKPKATTATTTNADNQLPPLPTPNSSISTFFHNEPVMNAYSNGNSCSIVGSISSCNTSSSNTHSPINNTSTSTSIVAAEDVFMSGRSRYREDFVEGRVLGRGGYGKVVLAENRLDGNSYAVKKIQFSGLSSNRYTRILREVKSLARLDHANIVRYHSAWIEDYAVILELIEEEDGVDDGEVTTAAAGKENLQASNRRKSANSASSASSSSAVVVKHVRSKSVPTAGSCMQQPALSGGHHHSHSLYHLQDRKIMYIQMELCLFTLDYYLKQRNDFYFAMAVEAKQLGRLPPGRELVLRDKTDRTIHLPAEQLFYWKADEGALHLRPGEVDRIFKGIVKGLHYIHEHGMIHRDLKPMNIFFQQPSEQHELLLPKIGDFGLVSENAGWPSISSSSLSSPSASESEQEVELVEISASAAQEEGNASGTNPSRTFHQRKSFKKTMGIGTVTYAAPEQLNQHDYTQKSDIYSLGIICFELYHPTGTQMERIRLLDDLKRFHRFPEQFLTHWPKEAAFIWSCIAGDASLRPSTREILESEWLDRDTEETMAMLAGENRMLRDMLREREEQIRLLEEMLQRTGLHEKEVIIKP